MTLRSLTAKLFPPRPEAASSAAGNPDESSLLINTPGAPFGPAPGAEPNPLPRAPGVNFQQDDIPRGTRDAILRRLVSGVEAPQPAMDTTSRPVPDVEAPQSAPRSAHIIPRFALGRDAILARLAPLIAGIPRCPCGLLCWQNKPLCLEHWYHSPGDLRHAWHFGHKPTVTPQLLEWTRDYLAARSESPKS